MTYKDLLHDRATRSAYVEEEIGVPEEEVPERIVVSPIPFEEVFPANFESRMISAGINAESLQPGDYIINKMGHNILAEYSGRKTLFAILGRGVVEFSDRIYLLSLIDNVRDIIFVGSAASLHDRVQTGDINVPELALPLENVSALHVDVNRAVPRADPALHQELVDAARKFSTAPVHVEKHATVTLFYQETRELLEFLRDFGVATIDMELSALYRITRFYGKHSAAIVRVSDMPLHGKHILDEEYARTKKTLRERAKEILFKTAVAATLGKDVAKRL